MIGSLGLHHIKKCGRTNSYDEGDYKKLLELINHSSIILSTNILTESSNLLESYVINKERVGLKALKFFINNNIEQYKSSKELSSLPSYVKFGLADASIHNLCSWGAIGITTDFNLWGYLISDSLEAINFNHIKSDSIF